MISIKNIILPNKPLNNFELEDAAKILKIPNFRGVFLLDTLPKKPNKKECGIVNFDKSGAPGTHWVAWYKNGKTKIYFDSYGVQPPIEVINYLGKPIYYNIDQEAVTTGDKALRKIQDGIFASTGEIDMSGNSITGLPNPIDRDAAANKNYVDNGGAITKLPNGAFTAVSDIDFNGFSLKNIPEPIDEKDAVNKAYVDGKTIQPAAPIKPIITVWAEEKGPLGDNHYEFSFGNGSSGSEHVYGGYCMSATGRIIRGSLTATESRNILSEEVKVNIVVNGKEQVNQSIVKKSGDICSCTIFRDPIELKQCDIINFISRTTNSKITNAYVSILIELDL